MVILTCKIGVNIVKSFHAAKAVDKTFILHSYFSIIVFWDTHKPVPGSWIVRGERKSRQAREKPRGDQNKRCLNLPLVFSLHVFFLLALTIREPSSIYLARASVTQEVNVPLFIYILSCCYFTGDVSRGNRNPIILQNKVSWAFHAISGNCFSWTEKENVACICVTGVSEPGLTLECFICHMRWVTIATSELNWTHRNLF